MGITPLRFPTRHWAGDMVMQLMAVQVADEEETPPRQALVLALNIQVKDMDLETQVAAHLVAKDGFLLAEVALAARDKKLFQVEQLVPEVLPTNGSTATTTLAAAVALVIRLA